MGRITIRKTKKEYCISEDGKPLICKRKKVDAKKLAFRYRQENKKGIRT